MPVTAQPNVWRVTPVPGGARVSRAGFVGPTGGGAGTPVAVPFAMLTPRDGVWTFSYLPYGFALTGYRQYAAESGSVTVTLYKNGVSVFSQAVSSATPADASLSVTYAAGDSLAVGLSSTSGAAGLQGTFLGVRT